MVATGISVVVKEFAHSEAGSDGRLNLSMIDIFGRYICHLWSADIP